MRIVLVKREKKSTINSLLKHKLGIFKTKPSFWSSGAEFIFFDSSTEFPLGPTSSTRLYNDAENVRM